METPVIYYDRAEYIETVSTCTMRNNFLFEVIDFSITRTLAIKSVANRSFAVAKISYWEAR